MAYGVYLNNPYIADPTYTVVQPTCTTPGSITINSTADSYSFDGGVTWGTNASLSNLTSYGYYNIITKNNIGCTSNTIYITIYDPNLPEPDYNYTNPSCGNIGNIVFNTSADYYSIDYGTNWSTNNVFTNLNAGYYGLVIKKQTAYPKLYTFHWKQQLWPNRNTQLYSLFAEQKDRLHLIQLLIFTLSMVIIGLQIQSFLI